MIALLILAYAAAGVKAVRFTFRYVIREMGYPYYELDGSDVAAASFFALILGLFWPCVLIGFGADRVGQHYAAKINRTRADQ